VRLAGLLIKQGQDEEGEKAERLRRFGLNPDGSGSELASSARHGQRGTEVMREWFDSGLGHQPLYLAWVGSLPAWWTGLIGPC
jgi:hypothetical protein